MERQATFSAGCFWGVEAAFRRLDGVTSTAVGYAGGFKEHPTYEQVCSDYTGHAEVVEVTYDEVCSHKTGHAEAVEVTYDPDRIPYEELLTVFFAEHDPTQLNRQGPDVGDQYRSVVFVHDPAQRAAAEAARDRVQQRLSKPVVTQIEDAPTFWPAEDYHQNFWKGTEMLQNGLTRAEHYARYRAGCGKNQQVETIWGKDAFRGLDGHA